LLPSILEVKGLITAAEYLPAARDHNVGGDWYDVFEPAPGQVAWVVGDVAGHGFGEAVVMAQLRNALRAYALDTSDPAQILTRLDRFLAAYLPNEPPRRPASSSSTATGEPSATAWPVTRRPSWSPNATAPS
jgi:serine phosphatase RsbU (regulator of sigma subunit)